MLPGRERWWGIFGDELKLYSPSSNHANPFGAFGLSLSLWRQQLGHPLPSTFGEDFCLVVPRDASL